MRKSRTPPWRKENPRKKSGGGSRKLTPPQREQARERAARAKRHYPNLVDNMWASTHVTPDGEVRQTVKRAAKAKKKHAAPKGGAKNENPNAKQKSERRRLRPPSSLPCLSSEPR